MATTYTLNVTATDIINALKAGKSILVHTSSDESNLEMYVTPSYISFNTTDGNESFHMDVSIGVMGNNVSFETSDLNASLTYEYNNTGDVS